MFTDSFKYFSTINYILINQYFSTRKSEYLVKCNLLFFLNRIRVLIFGSTDQWYFTKSGFTLQIFIYQK